MTNRLRKLTKFSEGPLCTLADGSCKGVVGVGGVVLFMCDTVDKFAETQTSIWKAIHLDRTPNSRSGGHEFESPVWRELHALTKVKRSLGSGLSIVVTPI